MKIYFHWYDKNGRNDFRVWPLYPRFKKYWSGELWYFSIWKWSMVFDFRKEGFWGYIKKEIWKGRLKDRQN